MSMPRRPIKWEVEETNPEQVEPLKSALRDVIDPELGLNLIELGLIRDVIFKTDETAHITMILTTPFCPYASVMIDATRKTAERHLGRVTTVELGYEAWDPSYMEEGVADDWGLY